MYIFIVYLKVYALKNVK